ncbi:beta-1,6-N-acetylglucosaminyltransferase [Lactiplantibacillus carotarum]|uniref:beta-1,6-N-acetylglucosaminyltransferase n=1 Tax=Lactiplantibacillus carotarum TaxID=2993456 RepID=UPI00298F23E7|nr:beta-1,6-N-acetylglucosaminyltransferase [Lactiplantibacillus carotarum]
MNRHAYLIIANRNIDQLQMLTELLDDSRNDIYILIDAKSSISKISFKTKYSKLTYVSSIKIYWGDYSQIQAELNLLRAATENGDYAFYHLLSGLDLPLANQDVIHDFFDDKIGYNFLRIAL